MGRLSNGEWLLVGNSIWSDDHGTELRMQEDGKLVVYHGDHCAWQNTSETNSEIHGMKMQEDGNLVIYNKFGTDAEHATWHTNTAHFGDRVYLMVQDDGNVVLYTDSGPVWATVSNK